QIGIADQEASRHLVQLTCHLKGLFDQLSPQVILTHAYEGGHPDHDATAFAVHHAMFPAELLEFSSYHRHPLNASIETACFLGSPQIEVQRFVLNDAQRTFKRRMLDCFASQRETLKWFRIDEECIRRAPAYNFTNPAHRGRLFYESFDWGVNSLEWLRLARRADRIIGHV